MARTARVVINRRAADAVLLGMADGLFDVAVQIKLAADVTVPDAPPYGQGLLEGGGAVAYAGTRKVAGTTIGGRAIAKPRALRNRAGIATAIVGWGFPGRFVHNGTVDTRADPWLLRAGMTVLGRGYADDVGRAVARRLGGRL